MDDFHLLEYQYPLTIILMEKAYCIYIMTNSRKNVLYTGYTSDLARRVQEHKDGVVKGFTQKYKFHNLVYYEVTDDAGAATAREKQIKSGSRSKKIELIESINPDWLDLYTICRRSFDQEIASPFLISRVGLANKYTFSSLIELHISIREKILFSAS